MAKLSWILKQHERNNMKSMVIDKGDHKILHMCNCFRFTDPSTLEMPTYEVIKTYYSEKQVQDAGWNYTDHIEYCPPNEEGVWVCPECWNK